MEIKTTPEQRKLVLVEFEMRKDIPIPLGELVNYTGLNERIIRQCCHDLMTEFGHPVIGLPTGGYIYTSDGGELREYAKTMNKRGDECYERAYKAVAIAKRLDADKLDGKKTSELF